MLAGSLARSESNKNKSVGRDKSWRAPGGIAASKGRIKIRARYSFTRRSSESRCDNVCVPRNPVNVFNRVQSETFVIFPILLTVFSFLFQ